jgi:dTDP-4-amino-4,6-dideoxygalactose transaminase
MASQLTQKLSDFEFLTPPKIRPASTHVYYLYPTKYDRSKLGVSRDTFITALQAEGIHASRYTTPVYRLPLFDRHRSPADPGFSRIFPLYDKTCDYASGLCPVAERVEDQEIVVTNICRRPNTMAEIDEFVHAVEKITEEVDALMAWEAGLKH